MLPHELQRGRPGQAGEQQGELVAAVAGEHGRRRQGLAPHLGDQAQHPVAGVVALRVVDGLEVVEVQEGRGHRLTGAGGRAHQLVQRLVEAAPVGQPGERVAVGAGGPQHESAGDHAQAEDHRVQRERGGQGDVALHEQPGGHADLRQGRVDDGERQAEEEAGGDRQEAGQRADREGHRLVGAQHHTGDDDHRRLQDGDVEGGPRPPRSPHEDDAAGEQCGQPRATATGARPDQLAPEPSTANRVAVPPKR